MEVLFCVFSWTVITWLVVVGSTVVMMLWILIYSFFTSIDFVDEVLILFGGVQFWATVLFTSIVALGAFFHIFSYFLLSS
jgi:phospholipid-translocating ATPase